MPGGPRAAGPAYNAQLRYDGGQFFSNTQFNDLSPGFNTLTGYIETDAVDRPVYVGRTISQPPLRIDMRGVSEVAMYRFRPEHKYLVSWYLDGLRQSPLGPSGQPLGHVSGLHDDGEFTGQTAFEMYWQQDQEMLRPQDFHGLTENAVYSHHRQGLYFETSLIGQVSFKADYSQGAQINIDPPSGQLPLLSNVNMASVGLVLRPENICAFRIPTCSSRPTGQRARAYSTTTSSTPSGCTSSTRGFRSASSLSTRRYSPTHLLPP